MKNQVLSTEQMQELIDMGIDTSNASMCWYKKSDKYILCNEGSLLSGYFSKIPTFTLQDMLEILPHTLEFQDMYGNTHFEYVEFWGDGWKQMAVVNPLHPSSPRITTSNISSLRSAFEMLKWCKENKYI